MRWIFVPLLFLLLGGLARAEVMVNKHPVELGDKISFKGGPGGLYLGYYTVGNSILYVKRVDEDLDKETAVSAKDMRGQSVNLSLLNDAVVLSWGAKASDGKKYIYVQRSEDGVKTFKKPIVVNSTTHALPPITIATDGGDRIYAVWLDERKGLHNLYMNYSLDGAKSFLKEDILLTPGFQGPILPCILLRGERVDLFFQYVEGERTFSIYHRYSLDGGKTWSEGEKIEEMEWTPFTIRALWAGDNILLFWAGVKGLHCARSGNGKTWEKIDFEETNGMDIYRLEIESKGSNVYIATSWVKRFEKDKKPNVYFYKSEDAGLTWSGPEKLNRNEYDTTSSTFPDIALGKEGTILVAWQDHRDIRGNIYINYSKDGGKTWLENDISLGEEPGKHNNSLPYVVSLKDRFYILWYRFTDDIMNKANLYMEEVSIE